MKLETYAAEVKTLITQFIHAFDSVVIKRMDNNDAIQDKIEVDFIYAPKQRVIHDLINKAQHIKLPIISVSISNLNRNVNRVFNKIDGPLYNMGINDTGFTHPLQPVPVDITVNMSIMTRFQSDMDQIITNFAPYCDPYIVVSWPAPYVGHEIRTIIKWSGNINLNYPLDINNTQAYRCIADTSFTIEGWLFKNVEEPVGKIYKIDTSFTAVSNVNATYPSLFAYETIDNTDVFVISARPQLKMCDPYYYIPCQEGKEFTIYGNMLDYTDRLFVSGSLGLFPEVSAGTPLSSMYLLTGTNVMYYNLFAGNSSLSAIYAGFSAVEVPSWAIQSNNSITFTMPKAVSAGYIDVIGVNEAGWGNLMKDALRPTLNPYPSSLPEYATYVEWQHPSVSGVYVAPFYYNCP